LRTTSPGEKIPNSDHVYVRVLLSKIKIHSDDDFTISDSAFHNTPEDGPDLSCDWDRFVTPTESWENISNNIRRNGTSSDPNKFIIVSFNVGDLLEIPVENVIYDPMNFGGSELINHAHSAIIKDWDDEDIKDKMSGLAKVEIVGSPEKVVLLAKIFRIKVNLHNWKDATKEALIEKRERDRIELVRLEEELGSL